MPPVAARSQDGRERYEELENDKSFLKLDSGWPIHSIPISQPLHQYNLTRESSNLFKSPKAPSSQLLSNSQHNESTLPSTLQPNSTQPNSTIYSSHTHTLNSTSGISPKSEPSLKPSEAGNVPRHPVEGQAAQSAQPQGLDSRRKADEKNGP